MRAATLELRSSKQYRLFPPPPPGRLEALRADIERRGVLVPIDVDESGNVIDGHVRFEIANALGIDCPYNVRQFQTKAEKVEHACKKALMERQLGPVSVGRSVGEILKARGIKRGQGSSAGKRWSQSATVADLATELGLPERTLRYKLQLAETLEGHDDLAAAVDAGEMAAKDALREIRRRSGPRLRVVDEEDDTPKSASIKVFHRDARDHFPGEGPADLAIFSPPYNVGIEYSEHDDGMPHEEWLELLGDSVKVLVEGWQVSRICINFPTGVGRKPYLPLLPDVLYTIEELELAECEGVIIWDKGTTGNRTSWGSWRSPSAPSLRDRTELVVVFRTDHELRIGQRSLAKDEDNRKVSPWLSSERFTELTQDLWKIPPESAQRVGHPAPFPIELPKRLIQLYGWPGCTVIDPFAGSGTTGLAALELGGLTCILGDNAEEYVALTQQRIREAR